MVFAIIAIGFGMEKGRRLTAQTDYEMTHVNESMYEFFIDFNSMHKNKKILSKNQKCQHVVIGGNQMSQSFQIVFCHFSPLNVNCTY